jgi:rod shape-determining protein MreC
MLIFQRYTWWVGAMIGLALFLAVASQLGALGPFQGAFLRITSPIERSVNFFVQPIGAFLQDAGNIRELRRENQELRLENESLRNRMIEIQHDEAELQELRAALNIMGDSGERSFEAASVVMRDSYPFTDVVRINKGSNHGIRRGMVVLSTQLSLVGTVTEVFPGHANVRLISDSRSAVNAIIANTAIDGSVRGTATRQVKMEMARGNISPGDEVVTSGVGDNYPRGLPIGRVVEVSGTPQDLELDITIEPRVRLSTLGTVLVETSFDPTRQALEGQ